MKRWVNCLGLLLVTMSHGLHAELGLNGVATYSELGSELFIAALYSGQTGTNAQELINGSYPKRIELKVLSKQGITLRQFNRLWRESIAINNTPDLLIVQADNMVKFEGLMLDRLEPNDHLVISSNPGAGVVVSLNTIELGHIDEDDFFGLLLRSWIGQVPSSTKFRDDLLKTTLADTALVARFNHMYPRTARIEATKNWLQASAPVPVDMLEAKAVLAPTAVTTIAKTSPPTQTLAASIPKATAQPKASDVSIVSSDMSKTTKVKAPTSKAKTLAVDSQNQQRRNTAQELLARQFYTADVFQKVYGQVNYPRRAQELRQMGTVRLFVVINAVGGVKTVGIAEASRFALLNNAALEAVKSAAPFAPLPGNLDLTELEVSLPITFALEGY